MKIMKSWPFMVATLCFLTGCQYFKTSPTEVPRGDGWDGSGAIPRDAGSPPDKATVVEVYYGTNRRQLDIPSKVEFGSARSNKAIAYGTCHVSIPPNHKTGDIELPWFTGKLSNLNEHMVLLNNEKFASQEELITAIKRRGGKKMFVFIHGYNVEFNDAALRTAQMAHDLKFEGAPIFFSWPAKGRILGYPSDENDIAWSVPYIKSFLLGLIAGAPDRDVYIIAHSMGTRGTTTAVKEIIETNKAAAKRIKEVILAAPDIDEGIFSEQIMPVLSDVELPTTIYTSNNDRALKLSSFLHGYLRVGSGFSGEKNLEVVDATEADSDFLGHSYFADKMLSDIYGIITYQHRANERFGLEPVSTTNGIYWKLKP
jgi:esterase/lipase superfamily enzyme